MGFNLYRSTQRTWIGYGNLHYDSRALVVIGLVEFCQRFLTLQSSGDDMINDTKQPPLSNQSKFWMPFLDFLELFPPWTLKNTLTKTFQSGAYLALGCSLVSIIDASAKCGRESTFQAHGLCSLGDFLDFLKRTLM